MREQFDGKHAAEGKSDEQMKRDAIESLQQAVDENVSEEEIEEALRKAKEREEINPEK